MNKSNSPLSSFNLNLFLIISVSFSDSYLSVLFGDYKYETKYIRLRFCSNFLGYFKICLHSSPISSLMWVLNEIHQLKVILPCAHTARISDLHIEHHLHLFLSISYDIFGTKPPWARGEWRRSKLSVFLWLLL